MLVDEHTEAAAVSEELHGGVKAVMAIEELESKAGAQAGDVGVEERIAEWLEEGSGFAGGADVGHLGEDFPITHVADGVDEPEVVADAFFDVVDAFDGDDGLDFGERHGGDFQAGEQVSAESLKVLAGESAAGVDIHFPAEGDVEVASNQLAVGPGERPRGETAYFSDHEDDWQGQQAKDRLEEAEERVDAPLPGASGEGAVLMGFSGILRHEVVLCHAPPRPWKQVIHPSCVMTASLYGWDSNDETH